jgi:CRP/FNR family transcriptional regulator, putaive post-exponential-phase nitrogen-starvation regulator
MQKLPYSRSCDRCLSDCGLDPAALRDLTLLRFAPGEFIVREGVPIAYLLFVVSGRAKACLTSAGGGDLILCYYVSEGILGDAELMLDSRPAISTTIAVTEFTCVGVPLTQNAETLKSNLAFVNRVGAELSRKLVRSSHSYLSDALHTARQRLCRYLLDAAQGDAVPGPMTDAAAAIGISYRHLMRLLRQLCDEGILSRTRRNCRILRRDALEKMLPE